MDNNRINELIKQAHVDSSLKQKMLELGHGSASVFKS